MVLQYHSLISCSPYPVPHPASARDYGALAAAWALGAAEASWSREKCAGSAGRGLRCGSSWRGAGSGGWVVSSRSRARGLGFKVRLVEAVGRAVRAVWAGLRPFPCAVEGVRVLVWGWWVVAGSWWLWGRVQGQAERWEYLVQLTTCSPRPVC
jgi:hypothetical protein